MKKAIIGLSIAIALILIAVVLFYLQFSSNKQGGNRNGLAKEAPANNFRIAYFEIDSIESQFEYYKEVSNAIQAKALQNNKQLNQLKEAFGSKYQELQRIAPTLTQAELASKQQELMLMEKTFQSKEQMMNNEMQDESTLKLQDVKRKISDFLKEYNKNRGYAFILGNNSDMLALYYKDTAYDITADVIRGLNELYKKKK